MAITSNNVQNVKFLRNQAPFETRDLARQALEDNKGVAADGTALLARYTVSDGQTTDVKTLIGFVAEVNSTKYVTIFDVEGGSEDVEKLRQEIDAKLGTGITSANTATEQLAALRGNEESTSAETSVEGAKRYADAKISGLDYTGVTTSDAAVVTNVTEADGIVAATSANVGALKLTGYEEGTASGHVESSDTINAAVAKLQNQIDAANDNVDAKIDALDYVDTAATGSYVSAVNEANGVISVTRVALPTVAAISEASKPITAVSESLGAISATAGTINAEFVNVTGSVFSSTTVQGALEEVETEYKAADDAIVSGASSSANTLGKLEAIVNDISADAKEYEIVKTTTGLPETVKERYSLVDASGNTSGATIDIPKDSHIVSITYITDTGDTHYQNLKYEYIDVSGNTQTTYVDMSELVLETEFASGITVTNHIAHGVVDPTSENFLTVDANGFKLSGVQDAIGAAATIIASGSSADTTEHLEIATATDPTTSAKTYTFNLKDIASQTNLNALSGKTFTVATSSNASITTAVTAAADGTKSVDLITDASKIKMSGFTSTDVLSGITSSSSITEAFKEVDEVITSLEATKLENIVPSNGIAVDATQTTTPTVSAKLTSASDLTSIGIAENAIKFDTTSAPGMYIEYLDCGFYV